MMKLTRLQSEQIRSARGSADVSTRRAEPNYIEIQRWLRRLWPNGLPLGCWITVAWKTRSRKFDQRSFRTLNQAGIWATRRAYQSDVWHECGIGHSDPGRNFRTKGIDVALVPGIWMDVDYGSVGHKGDSYPSTESDALELLAVVPPPTLILKSGHGLQPWWLFDQPEDVRDPGKRSAFEKLSGEIFDRIAHQAARYGWKIDPVHDLAHIMRIPGTFNRKISDDVVPVTLDMNIGKRWTPADLKSELATFIRTGAARETVNAVQSTPAEDQPSLTASDIATLRQHPVPAALLDGSDLTYPSASERDAAIAKYATNSGIDVEKIPELMALRRQAAGDDVKKAYRDDYVKGTTNLVSRDSGTQVKTADLQTPAIPMQLLERRLPQRAVLVWQTMMGNSQNGFFLKSREFLAAELKVSIRTVTRAWHDLQEFGFIRPLNRYGVAGERNKGWELIGQPIADSRNTTVSIRVPSRIDQVFATGDKGVSSPDRRADKSVPYLTQGVEE